jgi:hypothetical protein
MQGEKLQQAQDAALLFLDHLELQNRVGLITFNTEVRIEVPLDNLETNRGALQESIRSLVASSNTALFDAIVQSVALFDQADSANASRSGAAQRWRGYGQRASNPGAKKRLRARRLTVIVIPVAPTGRNIRC